MTTTTMSIRIPGYEPKDIKMETSTDSEPAALRSPLGFVWGIPTSHMPGQSQSIRKIRYPRFKTVHEERAFLKLHHAAAMRWLGSQGFGNEGAGGHMTVRDPGLPDHFWINPFGKSFHGIRPEDLVLVNEKGHVVGGNMHNVNPAGFYIHTAIHHARPDAHAVVHCHTVPGKAFSVFGKELDMLNQDCCQFYNCNTVLGQFDGFVLASEEGEHIAKALGTKNKAIVLQNHGLLVVGRSPDGAAFTFGAFNRCIEAQFLSHSLAQSSGFAMTRVSDDQARSVQGFYTDEFQYLTFQPAFEDMVHASNGELTMTSGGEIYPNWTEL